MSSEFKITWRPVRGYVPTQPVTGESSDTIYRGQNLLIKGGAGTVYAEQWRGIVSSDAAGTNPTLTGTVATTTGLPGITGTGTKFKTELIIGQLILISGRVHAIMSITSDTAINVSPVPTGTASGLTATFLKQLQEVDLFRATFVRGSLTRLPQGNLLGVGQGEVRLDGSTVPSGGWTLRNQLALAVLNNGTGDYSIFKLGMKKPATPTTGTAGGGVKNMQPGTYTVRIVPARTATGGFNNPSEAASVTIATAGDVIQITFPAMDTSAGQDAWRVYGTLFSTSESVSGPWYFVDQITTSAVSSGGGTVSFEWRDSEIQSNDILEFDNDPPPPGSFVSSLGGFPVLIGTNGPGRTLAGTAATTAGDATVTGTSTTFDVDLAVGRFVWINNLLYQVLEVNSATSIEVKPTPTANASGLTIRSADEAPGPVLRPAKPYLGGFNIEAFPARFGVALNPPETIIGFVEGIGRLYLLTPNRLHIAILSGDPDLPVVVRPFWRTGFRNPRACAFINGYLYGFTSNGATRSAGAGDAVREEHEFAAPVDSDMQNWNPSKVSVSYDPRNEAVLYMHADDGARASGKRYSTVLAYMLKLGVWSAPCRIEDVNDTDDQFATSAAAVNGIPYVLVSSITTPAVFFWDGVPQGSSGELGEIYAGTPFMDVGQEALDHNVRGMVVTATGSNPLTGNVYGVPANSDVPLTDFAAGTNSSSGDLSFTVNNPNIRPSERKKINVRRARLLAARVKLGNNSTGCRIDELVLDGVVSGVKY
jgi:hypothetical protein